MAKSYAKTYLRIGGRVYRPNEELPEITDEEWKRLTLKRAIVTEADPVQIATEEPGEDETQEDAPTEATEPKTPEDEAEDGDDKEDGDDEDNGDDEEADDEGNGDDEEDGDDAQEGEGNAPEMPEIDPAESVVTGKKPEAETGKADAQKKKAPKGKAK